MSMKKLSLVVLVCLAAFSCVPTCSASPKNRHARGNLLAQPIVARDWNVSFPITQAPLPDPSSTLPDGSPTPTCQTYSPCNLFYQVSRMAFLHQSRLTNWSSMCPYFTGRATRKTRLAWLHWAILHPRLLPLDSLCTFFSLCPIISQLINHCRTSPSIYAIFPSIMASDGCSQIGQGYGPITTSFAPGELSTIDIGGHSTNVFNFDDLPCPPSGIELAPGSTYAPLIAPPSFIFDLDPAFSSCIPGYSQGVDPPTAVTSVTNGIQGPGAPGGGRPARRDLGPHAHSHVAPWAPAKTVGPTHKGSL